MTVKDMISGVYRAVMTGNPNEAVEQLDSLLCAAGADELRKAGADLYMLFRFCLESDLFPAEAISSVQEIMDQLSLYAVSLGNKQHLVEIRNNDSLDVGIFVDSLEKLQEPFTVVERKYITDGYLHFIERIWRDANGLKFRKIELPLPPSEVVSGYDLQNGFLMEREENLKLMLEEDE